nr:hypothetical protein [uncultured Bacteroides sp.]
MRKYVYILLLIAGTIKAQNVNVPTRSFQVIPKSPMVAQFSKYDELPVSEYTGLPNISVPLYNIEEDDLKIPLSLTYHAGGIKVNQDASWVGLGWDLSLGCVMQYINDQDDFLNKRKLPDYLNTSMSNTYGYASFPMLDQDFGDICSNSSFSCDDPLPIVEPKAQYNYWISTSAYFSFGGVKNKYDNEFYNEEYIDSEPDIFKIKLLDATLNVIIDFKTGSFVVLNKKGYKINKTGDTWNVVNPNGEQFFFSDNSYTISAIYPSIGGGYAAKQTMRIWMLNKIVTKHGKEIIINYIKSSDQLSTTSISQTHDILLNSQIYPGNNTNSSCNLSSGTSPVDRLIETNTTNKEYQFYLKSIKFPKGYLSFSISGREDLSITQKLDGIKLFNNLDQEISIIEFNYDYFLEKNGKSKRLKLLSVRKNDETYKFLYNSTLLPTRNSFEQDYWGYYNGVTSNKSLIPNPKRFGYGVDNSENHSANLPYTKAGVLEEITYPTGGKIHFDYELNTFNNYWVPDIDSLNNKISKGLGLRIKSMVYKDYSNNEIKRTSYKYDEGKAILYVSMMEKFIRNFYEPVSSGYRNYCTSFLNASSNGFYTANPLASITGVGYGKVTKYYSNSNDIGLTETFYNNNPDNLPSQTSTGTNIVSFSSLPAFKKLEYPENGTMRLVRNYNKNGVMLNEISYEYTNSQSSIYYGAKMSGYATSFVYVWIFYDGFEIYYLPKYIVGYYPIVDIESLLTRKIEKEFIGKDSITKNELYYYNKNNFICSTVQNNSLGKSLYQHYYYTQDYSDAIYKLMESNNMLSNVIEKLSYTCNGVNKEREITNYTNDASITNGLILPASVQTSFLDKNDLRNNIIYNIYDVKGNILQYTRLDGTIVSYLWSYNYQYPVAEIINASYDEVKNNLGIDTDVLSQASDPLPYTNIINALRSKTALSKAQISTYKYKPLLGIIEATNPFGFTTYYNYDSFGRLEEKYIIENSEKKVLGKYDYQYVK